MAQRVLNKSGPASATLLMLVLASGAVAEPLAAPGDMRLRHDLQLLNDSGAINIPLTAWPVSLGDVNNAIDGVDGAALNKSNLLAQRTTNGYGV